MTSLKSFSGTVLVWAFAALLFAALVVFTATPAGSDGGGGGVGETDPFAIGPDGNPMYPGSTNQPPAYKKYKKKKSAKKRYKKKKYRVKKSTEAKKRKSVANEAKEKLRKCRPASEISEGRDGQWKDWGSDDEARSRKDAIRGFLDEWESPRLVDWLIDRKVGFYRYTIDNLNMLTAGATGLNFKEGYFTGERRPSLAPGALYPMNAPVTLQSRPRSAGSDTARANLLAFEAGKVFWNMNGGMKLQSIFGEILRKKSQITQLREANYRYKNSTTESMVGITSDPVFDKASAFAYLFRALVLGLSVPGTEEILADFGTKIGTIVSKCQ